MKNEYVSPEFHFFRIEIGEELLLGASPEYQETYVNVMTNPPDETTPDDEISW